MHRTSPKNTAILRLSSLTWGNIYCYNFTFLIDSTNLNIGMLSWVFLPPTYEVLWYLVENCVQAALICVKIYQFHFGVFFNWTVQQYFIYNSSSTILTFILCTKYQSRLSWHSACISSSHWKHPVLHNPLSHFSEGGERTYETPCSSFRQCHRMTNYP